MSVLLLPNPIPQAILMVLYPSLAGGSEATLSQLKEDALALGVYPENALALAKFSEALHEKS